MAETKDIQKKQETQMQHGVEPTRAGRLFTPPTDICETNDCILLTADMPGVRPDGVNVMLENNVLTVRGAVADEHSDESGAAYAEYEVGDYERSFSLSEKIDADNIEARMNNGVLTLTLPKTRPSHRQIEVKTG